MGVGSGGQKGIRLGIFDHLLLVDDSDRDRLVRASLDTRRRFAIGQSITAHVTLADNSFAAVVFGHVVGASQRAVLTPETLIVQMFDDARDRVLFIGIDWTSLHAARF